MMMMESAPPETEIATVNKLAGFFSIPTGVISSKGNKTLAIKIKSAANERKRRK